MAKQWVVAGSVTPDARPVMENLEYWRCALRVFAGEQVEYVIRKKKSKRSLDQNAFWWAEPVERLAEFCGNTPAQMHYALLGECFGYTAGPTWQAVPIKASSSDLSVEEFKHLIDWVLVWAPSTLGVALQSPDEWMLAQ